MRFGNFISLAKKKALSKVHQNGKLLHSKSFFIKFIPSEVNKAAFLIKRKIGIAVFRNLIKKRTRHILSPINHSEKIHILFFFKPEIKEHTYASLKEEIEKIMIKCYKINYEK